MKNVDRIVQNIVGHTLDLQDAWRDEDQAAQWPTRGDMPAISKSGTSDPTGRTASNERRLEARNRIEDGLRYVERKLESMLADAQPKRTGPCDTEGCEREGITRWNGRCEKCGPWMRSNPGFEPDDKLIEDWNGRRWRECGCDLECCPNGCLDLVPPPPSGKTKTPRPMSERCLMRQSRARKDDGSDVGTGGAFRWQDAS